MTIKKPTKSPEAEAPVPAMPNAGGATIADRFKLDLVDPNAKKASAGKGTMCTVLAGLVALGVVGVLTFIIYQHWQYLANA